MTADWAVRDTLTGATYPQPNKLIAIKVAEMHGHCEVIHLTPPTDNEREALADLIDGVGVYIAGSHGHDYINPGKAANAVFAAGFRLIAPTPEALAEALCAAMPHDGGGSRLVYEDALEATRAALKVTR